MGETYVYVLIVATCLFVGFTWGGAGAIVLFLFYMWMLTRG